MRRKTVSKVNSDYALRAVTAAEIIERFGTAEAAMRATGGDEAIALFFIHNPEAQPNKLRVRKVKTNLAKELKDEVDKIADAVKAEKLNEQIKIAAAAYNETPDIKSIRKACKCKNVKAADLLVRAIALGLVKPTNAST
jgi:hypothetical protein